MKNPNINKIKLDNNKVSLILISALLAILVAVMISNNLHSYNDIANAEKVRKILCMPSLLLPFWMCILYVFGKLIDFGVLVSTVTKCVVVSTVFSVMIYITVLSYYDLPNAGLMVNMLSPLWKSLFSYYFLISNLLLSVIVVVSIYTGRKNPIEQNDRQRLFVCFSNAVS